VLSPGSAGYLSCQHYSNGISVIPYYHCFLCARSLSYGQNSEYQVWKFHTRSLDQFLV
jgi:hypothetical protein